MEHNYSKFVTCPQKHTCIYEPDLKPSFIFEPAVDTSLETTFTTTLKYRKIVQMLWAWCLARINQQILYKAVLPLTTAEFWPKILNRQLIDLFEAIKKLIRQGLHPFAFDTNYVKAHKSDIPTFSNYH